MERGRASAGPGADFIRQVVAADLESGRYGGRVVTRFPPEPNGYLHVGHAMGICLNFGIAQEFSGRCHLRYDDTNPEAENEEFVRSIENDVRWLGFDWGEHLYFASDYFERMYECAESLISKGFAYVDSQPTEAIRVGRGTVTEPGIASPFRDRSPEENLDLFRRMRAGEFPDGAHVLRGKIDMASPNMLMRDPVLYRIRHAHHYRQGDDWCIYPLYDYAHCLEDAFEGVTHSICTLEFDNNRELYDWVLDSVGFREPRPHQYEWAGLDLEGAVLSKRRIKPLVEAGIVSGWDDPRLATLAAYRRRGIPPEAIRLLSKLVGVSKTGAKTEAAKLDFAVREVLNPVAPRVMAVLDPLKVVLTNYPQDRSEEIDAPLFPHDVPREGSRPVPFSRELWIECSDFEEDPPSGFRRLVPGGEVRLRYAFVIRCEEVIKDERGRVIELRCTYDPESRGGSTADGRRVKGTIQWVSVPHAVEAEVRLFDRLLLEDVDFADTGDPFDEEGDATDVRDVTELVNPESLVVVGAKIEPSVLEDPQDTRYQFERTGYFWRDPVDGAGETLVFNRIVPLKDAWSRREASSAEAASSGRDAEETMREGSASEASTRRGAEASAERQRRSRTLSREVAERSDRYRAEHGVSQEFAELLATFPRFFEDALAEHGDAQTVASWIVVDLRGLLGDRSLSDLPFGGASVGRLASLADHGTITRRAAKDVLARMIEEGGEPEAWVSSMGLEKVSDADTIGAVVDSVLERRPDKVAEYRQGKKGLIGFFVGEVMRETGGAADPSEAKRLLAERLSG